MKQTYQFQKAFTSAIKNTKLCLLLIGMVVLTGCVEVLQENDVEVPQKVRAEIPEEVALERPEAASSEVSGDVSLEESKEVSSESVKKYSDAGALRVEGTQLIDSSGEPLQLRGTSTHGLAWFPKYVNQAFFTELSGEWNANVVRLAMYTAENGGYCTDGNKEELKQLIKDGIQYATQADLYVIVDWHILSDGNPHTYKEDAKAFLKKFPANMQLMKILFMKFVMNQTVM